MECTPEEIERKRRLALAKLQAKKLLQTSPQIDRNTSRDNHTSSPIRFNFNANASPSSGVKRKLTENNPNSLNSTLNVHNEHTSNSSSSSVGSKPAGWSGAPNNTGAVSPQKFFGKTVTGSMELISECRFEVNMDGFSAKAIDVFKTIPSRNYSKFNISLSSIKPIESVNS